MLVITGRYGPEGMLRVAVQKTVEFPQLQFIAGHRHPVRAAEADPPWSRLFSRSPPFVFGGRCPCHACCAVSQVPLWRRHRALTVAAR